MPNELQPKSIRDLGIYGVIRQNEVDDHLIPDGAVTDVVNFSFDQKGAATLRTGLAAIGSTVSAGNSCLGIFNTQSATLVAAFNGIIYNRQGSTWDQGLTGLSTSAPIRFVDFASRLLAVNGTTSMNVWNGSNAAGWVTTGTPINPQNLYNNTTLTAGVIPKYLEVFHSTVYAAGDPNLPDRLFYSSVISTAGNITWSPDTNFVDINPSDGENITALKRYATELLIFKPNYIYRLRATGIDPDPSIKVGTRSHESVIEGKKGLYFFHETGFYRYTGGYPTEISRAISDFVANIPYSQYSIMPAWKDSDHIYWYLGNVTINEPIKENVVYNSVVARYTESSDVWTIYSYPFGLVKGTSFNSGSAISQVVGLNTGVVVTYNSGTTDLTQPIIYRLVSKWYEWDGLDNKKVIQRILSLSQKAQGCTLMYQTDYDPYTWRDLGQLKQAISMFETLNITFRAIRFKWAGVTSNEAPIIQGLEIPTLFKDDRIV